MKKAVFCICLSAFGFSLMAMFVRLADSAGTPIPAVQKAFFRNLVAIGIALPVFLRAPRLFVGESRPSVSVWVDVILRSVLGTLGIFTNFYAISHIPLGDSMALNKTAPFFTLLLSWPLLGEVVRPRQFLCVAGAFLGAMFVVKPGFAGGLNTAALIGLLSGFCAGSAYAILHRLGKRGVNAAFIIMFFSVFSCIACVPFLLVGYCPMTGLQVLILCAAGAGAALGQFGITWAYRYAEPRQIAVYDYSGVLFSAVLGFLAFGQIPDVLSVVGFVLIISMAVLLPRPGQPSASNLFSRYRGVVPHRGPTAREINHATEK